MRDFRFSSNVFGITTREEFVAACRDAESCGYDTIFCADHLGIPAPFPLLVAAAEATQRLRVGTLVLNVPFWNPALLAREVATTDILTEGRLELGLGSGHMKWEFDEAGIGWLGPSARAEKLAPDGHRAAAVLQHRLRAAARRTGQPEARSALRVRRTTGRRCSSAVPATPCCASAPSRPRFSAWRASTR